MGSAAAAAMAAPFWALDPTPPPAVALGQQPSAIDAELTSALSRAGPAERVPVLIEVTREEPPLPGAAGRDIKAMEQASSLAALYRSSVDRLRARLPSDLALDLVDADLLWIGGAVAARLTPAQIRALDGRSGVRRLYYDGLVQVELAGAPYLPPALWVTPSRAVAAQDPSGGLPWGLLAINAPEVWEAGATGQGTVVAIIDSGVDGDHALLRRKWRGSSTSTEEGWFDPWGLTDVPVDDDPTGGIGHGTIVATVAVGSLEPGDTLVEFGGMRRVVSDELEVVTGVAPGAQWVAANAFEFFGGAAYTRRSVLLQSMQWVLDPDGDPATATDVPDVVNNSWGFPPSACDGAFDRAIDALELAGVPVVFAAGNRSPGFDSVAAPANRADLLLNAFAVGAADRRDGEIFVADNSLGGPSPCAPGAIKPEVVAPGNVTRVRSEGPNIATVAGNSGAFTSWAAPHSSGALAVLRGLNPGASAHELKDALFSTAVDLPPPGLDNRSGAGFIDLAAAAERVGGLGTVVMQVAGWSWDSAGAKLTLELVNAGAGSFAGGHAELWERGGAAALAAAPAPPIRARGQGSLTFALRELPRWNPRLTLRLESEGAILELEVALGAAPVTAVQLQDGAVSLSLDAHGRIGRVAGPPGFVLLGRDWLTAGATLLGVGEVVSDAAYVDVLQNAALKSNPVGSDTDWRGEVLVRGTEDAELAYSDRRALRPLGAAVEQSAALSSLGDTAAFVALTTRLSVAPGAGAPLAGLMLDWDLGSRDSVVWDAGMGASVMTAADSSGPWVALTTFPRPPATHAAVPLGSPGPGGFYDAARGGVLSRLEGFSDETKSLYLRLGGAGASSSGTTDWAQLVAVGPWRGSETVVFLIAAARSRSGLSAAVDSARAFADAQGLAEPARTELQSLQLLPPYPNPFDPLTTAAVNLPFLLNRGGGALRARLQIYTVAGRLVYSERRDLDPNAPLEPFRWSGRLSDGEPAATGVYGYVITVGDQKRSGKFLLLK